MPEPAQHRRVAVEKARLPDAPARRGAYRVVLDAALRLFAERGYGGTSVRDIATAADVQPATLYAHFPSKAHVLAELVRIGHEAHHQRMREALLEVQPSPRLQLAAMVRAHVSMHADYPMLAVVANAELHALPADLAAPALQLRRQSEQLMLEIVERGLRMGEFSVAQPWLAVAAIGAMGLRVAHWYTPESGMSVDTVAEAYVEFAWRIVGAKAS
ncbi:TetR/AcrR family transcriptional regulator [Sinimarinibacterium thermocellulolyticum]|uniref:TetR/AcrR family transcriptional regulator n=1 Tax=Sinimarinibacterium thermocellulolyticum TaxID=3170016 RepID=A0ABV2A9P6_9GAMM